MGRVIDQRHYHSPPAQRANADPSPGAPAGALVAARDLRYEYDAAGRVHKIVDGGANTITEYTYDADARRIRATLFQGNAVIRATGIACDALGRMVRIANPGHSTRYLKVPAN